MPLVDVMDDTFVRAGPTDVRGRTGTSWATWLPDLVLTVVEDRAEQGLRWSARTSAAAGTDLTGSAEVWLEAVAGGTVAHLYVRLDRPGGGLGEGSQVRRGARRARRLPDRLRLTWKRGLHAWKDTLEGERST